MKFLLFLSITYCSANLIYFHLFQTKFENFNSLTYKNPKCWGWWGSFWGHFGAFLTRPSTVRLSVSPIVVFLCSLMGFKTHIWLWQLLSEGKYMELCHFYLLIGNMRSNLCADHASWSCFSGPKNCTFEMGRKNDINLCILLPGGSKWYFNYSYACCKTCVGVINASFDPPLEIVFVYTIYKYITPKGPSDKNFFWVYTKVCITA